MDMKEGIKLRIETMPTIKLNQINPRVTVAIGVSSTEALIATLDDVCPISKKITLPIPAMLLNNSNYTWIKSVQFDNNLLVAELDGPMTPEVRLAIRKILDNMKEVAMTAAFFPVNVDVKKSTYFFTFGENPMNLSPIKDFYAKNIRIINNDNLVFSYGNTVKKIERNKISLDDWKSRSLFLLQGEEPLFIGRYQRGHVPVTTGKGEVFMIDTLLPVDNAVKEVKQPFMSRCLAYIGCFKDGFTSAVQKGLNTNELVLIP